MVNDRGVDRSQGGKIAAGYNRDRKRAKGGTRRERGGGGEKERIDFRLRGGALCRHIPRLILPTPEDLVSPSSSVGGAMKLYLCLIVVFFFCAQAQGKRKRKFDGDFEFAEEVSFINLQVILSL
ncbi:unnamed protein product [Nezara viridula]|uniref:Uncharacterized protein n=1 Tax=Nezara viridula TaxID=85310 RepID=A0A9P0HTQ4_NEZVI|nr:unnamed protein product [Nezara viridula]